ncbi:hypothetical protein OAQ34_02470 [Opitutales bacterium]|nr:hypothetical protein [Opitutales bacterium]
MLNCDFSDETESFQGSFDEALPVHSSNGSWEWEALFGGAVGWLLGRTERPRVFVPPSACGEGEFTPEEKEFFLKFGGTRKNCGKFGKKSNGGDSTSLSSLLLNPSSRIGVNSFQVIRGIHLA